MCECKSIIHFNGETSLNRPQVVEQTDIQYTVHLSGCKNKTKKKKCLSVKHDRTPWRKKNRIFVFYLETTHCNSSFPLWCTIDQPLLQKKKRKVNPRGLLQLNTHQWLCEKCPISIHMLRRAQAPRYLESEAGMRRRMVLNT